MEKIIELWNAAGRFEQTAIAVVAALGVYVFVRLVVLRRMERLAANTSNVNPRPILVRALTFLLSIA